MTEPPPATISPQDLREVAADQPGAKLGFGHFPEVGAEVRLSYE